MEPISRASRGERRPRVSVVISSYNYERFVGETIRSALAQEDPDVEVIVIDDGSTDSSREVIESFGDAVVAVAKENGGHASALNAGYELSSGEAVIFLDSDDVLLPGASHAVSQAIREGAARAQWPMPIIDARSQRTGEIQDPELPQGDFRSVVASEGPLSDQVMPHPPTSGNAFARAVLERLMPIPEELYRRGGGDEYLCSLAAAFGPIARLEPQSLYRIHGSNEHSSFSFERMLAFERDHHAVVFERLASYLRQQRVGFDERSWSRSAWWLRAARVVEAIERHVPPGERLALLDAGILGIEGDLRGRGVIDFPERNGVFLGVPETDLEMDEHLERLLSARIRYLIVAWPAFWWVERYPSLVATLRTRFRRLAAHEDVMIFERDGD